VTADEGERGKKKIGGPERGPSHWKREVRGGENRGRMLAPRKKRLQMKRPRTATEKPPKSENAEDGGGEDYSANRGGETREKIG